MYSVLLTIHVLVTLFLIGIILVQRSASDGMGLSGSSSNNFLSGRAAASAVTRATAILAALFILSSLGLGIITTRSHTGKFSIMDQVDNTHPAPTPLPPVTPATTPAGAPATPVAPTAAAPTPTAPAAVPVGTPATPTVPRPQ